MSDIEGKATRVGASERGQRTSFNGSERDQRPGSCDLLLRSTPFNNNYRLSIVSCLRYMSEHAMVAAGKACSAVASGDRRICAAKMASGPIVGEWFLSGPKESPWKLRAQFLLSRERDVANIIA